ncbi:hypothetical protein ONZ45_g17933 [Pleurotus djamor]|nr:hypothetical protein ONZ45_g17933 [Pleurotus djamor]
MPKDLTSTAKITKLASRASLDAYFTRKPSASASKSVEKATPKESAVEEEEETTYPDPTATSLAEATLESLEKDTMHSSWYKVLQKEFTKPYFIQLKKTLASEKAAHTIYPELSNIYSWSRYTPLDAVRVVVLGQDPYHNVGQAHGLSFSVLPPTKLPGSLRNIYKQMETDIPGFKPPTSGFVITSFE